MRPKALCVGLAGVELVEVVKDCVVLLDVTCEVEGLSGRKKYQRARNYRVPASSARRRAARRFFSARRAPRPRRAAAAAARKVMVLVTAPPGMLSGEFVPS